jgi:hypothetical protein
MRPSPTPRALRLFLIPAGILFGCSTGLAQSKHTCTIFFKSTASIHDRLVCGEALLSDPRFHFTGSSLPPGNGIALGGVFEDKRHFVTPYVPKPLPPLRPDLRNPRPEFVYPQGGKLSSTDFKVAIVGSENQSWVATGSFTFVPGLYTPGSRPDRHHIPKSCQQFLAFCTKAQLALHFEGTHRSLQTISFYGMGPVSPAIKHTFHQNDTYGIASARLPLTNQIVVEGGLQILKTDLPTTTDPLSVVHNFDNATAPGLSSQPAFIHPHMALLTSPTVAITSTEHIPDDNRHGSLMTRNSRITFNNSARYDWYAAPSDSTNSFQQLLIKADETIELGSFVHRLVFDSDIKNAFSRLYYDILQQACGSIIEKRNPAANDSRGNAVLKVNQKCVYGKFDLRGQLNSSYTGTGSTVPFYLRPTVGGSDINSQASLRGFPNYRFRDRNTVFVQAEYSATVYDPIGILLFYDAGTVGPTVSSLSFAHLRQDGGVGITFRVQGGVAAQVYLAAGAGHGPLLNFNFTKFF